MSKNELKKMVQRYLDELEFMHPFVKSDKFITNSYSKWACREIIDLINRSDDLPFVLTPLQLLEQFRDRMNRYAYMDSKHGLGFIIATETADYLIEQYWRHDAH